MNDARLGQGTEVRCATRIPDGYREENERLERPEAIVLEPVARNAARRRKAHPSARLDEAVELGEDTWVDARSDIGKGCALGTLCRVGRQSRIGPRSRLGRMTQVGRNTTLGRGVRMATRSSVGDHVVIEAAVVIGKGVRIAVGAVIGRRARIGDDAVIGAEAHVRPNAEIGRGAVIGVGTGTDPGTGVVAAHAWVGSGESVPPGTTRHAADGEETDTRTEAR